MAKRTPGLEWSRKNRDLLTYSQDNLDSLREKRRYWVKKLEDLEWKIAVLDDAIKAVSKTMESRRLYDVKREAKKRADRKVQSVLAGSANG